MEDRPFAIRATTASLPSATVFVRAGSSQAVTSGRGINACMDGQPLPPWAVSKAFRDLTNRPASPRLSASRGAGAFHCSGKAGTVVAMMTLIGSSGVSPSTGPTGTAEPRSSSARSSAGPRSRRCAETASGLPGRDRCPSAWLQNRTVLPPNRVSCVSLGVERGRFSAGNRPLCGPWRARTPANRRNRVTVQSVCAGSG